MAEPKQTPSPPVEGELSLGPLPEGLREVKVRLPAKQVLRLHYAKMKDGKNFSQIVSTALSRYFDELAHGK